MGDKAPTVHIINTCLLLPFVCILLLPSIKLERGLEQSAAKLRAETHLAPTARLLGALLRLPFERLHLESGLSLAAATPTGQPQTGQRQATPIRSARSDLQEEEQQQHTQVVLLAPSSEAQRAGFAQDSPAAAAYVEAPPSMAASTGGGAGETQPAGEQGALVAAEGTSSASALQSRNDLPAVRALNVKCEKNHMTVSAVGQLQGAHTQS